MTYTPADVPSFMGLDLADVEDARGAIEATDCYVDDGRLVPRGGFDNYGTEVSDRPLGSLTFATTGSVTEVMPNEDFAAASTATLPSSTTYPKTSLYPYAGSGTGPVIFAGYESSAKLLNMTGAAVDTETVTAGPHWSIVAVNGCAWGANGATTIVRASATDLDKPTCKTRKLDEQVGSFDSHSGRTMPRPIYLGVQTPDNRLVAAGFVDKDDGPNGAATTPATVFFSQPDDPLKWDETEFEIVGSSSDPITGLANWGDYLIAFKTQEWYVFYGNSVRTDGTGLAVFNYRKVEAGCTVVSSVAGSRALYVLDSRGNIRTTTGGVPQVVFRGDKTKYAPVVGQGFRAGRFIGFPVTKNSAEGYLVLDEDTSMVFFWTLPLKAGSAWGNVALFPYTTGVASFPDGATDNGTTVKASYASAYSSWGQAGVEKSVRQTMFHGTGTVSVSWAKDLQSYGFPRSVTMRAGRGIDRNAVRGETLSYKLTGSGFTLNRLVPMLREQRPSGVRA